MAGRDRTNPPPPPAIGVVASKAELFAYCDVLSLHLRLKPDTRHCRA